MAFGVSPKHVRDQIFHSLTYEEILITALEAAKKLNWKIGFTSQRAFIAYTKFSMSSWGEEIKVNVEHQKLIVKSECTGNQLIDWGKNKKNVDAFLKAFQGNCCDAFARRGCPPLPAIGSGYRFTSRFDESAVKNVSE